MCRSLLARNLLALSVRTSCCSVTDALLKAGWEQTASGDTLTGSGGTSTESVDSVGILLIVVSAYWQVDFGRWLLKTARQKLISLVVDGVGMPIKIIAIWSPDLLSSYQASEFFLAKKSSDTFWEKLETLSSWPRDYKAHKLISVWIQAWAWDRLSSREPHVKGILVKGFIETKKMYKKDFNWLCK